MIEITDKTKCCGCGGCMNICPKHCISMKADEEGFLYPAIDKTVCVNCGLCERVCPILNYQPESYCEQSAYLVQNKDEGVRRESTSGGAFTAIARYVLEKDGVVFGAAFDEKFYVHHTYTTDAKELWRFRNSKYVQSDTENTFSIAEQFLKEGRLVCYSGTPCQIEGLKRYLREEYDNLLMVDVVCRAVPSPLVWQKYLEYHKVSENRPDRILFRDKFYGYKYSTMSLIYHGKNRYHAGAQLDPYLRAFFSEICDRPSCHSCPFKKRFRVSDLTLWDCFSVFRFDKKMDDDKGVTRVLCHTEKGKQIIHAIRQVAKIREIAPEKAIIGANEMFESVQPNLKRAQFMADARTLPGKELFQKYYPMSIGVMFKTCIRTLLLVTGIYGIAKRHLNKIRGR